MLQLRPSESAMVSWWFAVASSSSGLKTTQGESLIVLDSGRPNDGPGPDVLDATLAIDGKILSGAVEMHRIARGWYEHGHHLDDRYDRVILHVVEQSDDGPDLPTLKIFPRQVTGECRAQRAITPDELYLAASDRFRQKLAKVVRWRQCKTDRWSVAQLGLLDVMAYGPDRRKLLRDIQSLLKISFPPQDLRWSGSRQSRPVNSNQWQKIIAIIEKFPAKDGPDLATVDWEQWESFWVKELSQDRISRGVIREWLVNWIVPVSYTNPVDGLKVWQTILPARHYGFERKMGLAIGWPKVHSVLEQQGLLYWWQMGCVSRRCLICPLARQMIRENLSKALYDKRLANSSLVNYERIG